MTGHISEARSQQWFLSLTVTCHGTHQDPGFWHFLNTTADYLHATYKSQLQLLAQISAFPLKIRLEDKCILLPSTFNQLSRGLGKQLNKSMIRSQDKALYQGKSFPRPLKICPQLSTLKLRSYNSLWAHTLSVPPAHAQHAVRLSWGANCDCHVTLQSVPAMMPSIELHCFPFLWRYGTQTTAYVSTYPCH